MNDLFNIDFNLIPDDVIIQIAENLGCNYKPPKKFTMKIFLLNFFKVLFIYSPFYHGCNLFTKGTIWQ